MITCEYTAGGISKSNTAVITCTLKTQTWQQITKDGNSMLILKLKC